MLLCDRRIDGVPGLTRRRIGFPVQGAALVWGDQEGMTMCTTGNEAGLTQTGE